MRFSKISGGGRFKAIQAYLKIQEKHQINNLTIHLRQLEKEEKNKPKVRRRKEIINIRAEISEKERRETRAKINKTKSWFLEKIEKPEPDISRKKGRRIKSIKLEMKMERSQQTKQKYKGS